MDDVLKIEVKIIDVKIGKLTIYSKDGLPQNTEISFDGIPQKNITRVSLDISAKGLPQILLFVLPGSYE